MNKKIQILRALAIIGVVMIHTNVSGYPSAWIRPFINYAVGLFIFCSGYLTKIEIKDLKTFYKKRLIRVIIPYILWSLIFTITAKSYSNLLVNLLTANANSTFYYIFVYIQLVLLTPLIGKLLKSKFRWIGWLITPISIIIIRYASLFTGIEIQFPFSAILCIVWFIFYYIGMGLGNNIFKYKKSWKYTIGLYIITILFSEIESAIWVNYGSLDLATTALRLTSVLSSSAACLLAYKYLNDDKTKVKNNTLNKILTKIGDCSFGIYLSHTLVIAVLTKIPGYSYLFFPLKSFVVVGVTTLCVMIGHKILGKYAKYAGL